MKGAPVDLELRTCFLENEVAVVKKCSDLILSTFVPRAKSVLGTKHATYMFTVLDASEMHLTVALWPKAMTNFPEIIN